MCFTVFCPLQFLNIWKTQELDSNLKTVNLHNIRKFNSCPLTPLYLSRATSAHGGRAALRKAFSPPPRSSSVSGCLLLCSNQHGDVAGDNRSSSNAFWWAHPLWGHLDDFRPHTTAGLVLPVRVRPWPRWSWQRLRLPRLFRSTVTAALALTTITTAAATRIPAAVTRITAVSCCRAAGRIHSGVHRHLLCNP